MRRPRVRDTEERFESRLLPLFVKRSAKVADLIPELYLHGLSEGDFDLALRGLLGADWRPVVPMGVEVEIEIGAGATEVDQNFRDLNVRRLAI